MIIVGRLITPALRPLPYALIAFFFIDQLRLLAAAIPFLPRLLFLVEMLGAILLSLWLVRSPKRRQLWISAEPDARPWTTFIGYMALSISFTAFLANVLGYVTLANLLGNGLLKSSYLALILYASVVVLDELVQMALISRQLAALGAVSRHRPLLHRRLRRGLQLLAVVLWVLGVLQQLLLLDLLFSAAQEFLTAELSIGSIDISLGDVLAFCITVWAAFALSRFVRFLLEEDVYPRVHLKRGLSYAISNTLHYCILVVGFFFAVAALGFDMTRVTILAGAFGVGVGFGLQNIFNNFISGLIVLIDARSTSATWSRSTMLRAWSSESAFAPASFAPQTVLNHRAQRKTDFGTFDQLDAFQSATRDRTARFSGAGQRSQTSDRVIGRSGGGAPSDY